MIRIIICDHNELIRGGLTAALQQDAEFFVVGSVATSELAVELAGQIKPDLMVIDSRLPGLDAEMVAELKRLSINTKILLVLKSAQQEEVDHALELFADAYCVKSSPVANFVRAVAATAVGGCWLDPEIADRVIKGRNAGSQPAARRLKDDKFGLSARELEVLQLVTEGLSNREIAQSLSIGSETIKTHLRNVMDKLQVRDRTQAAVIAIREGLVQAVNETDQVGWQ